MIKIALNQYSCKKLNLIDFIKYSKDFKAVELNYKRIRKALSEKIKLKDILDLLESYDTKLLSIFQLKDFSLSSERVYKTKVLKNLNLMTDYCNKLECNLIILNPSFLEDTRESKLIPKWRIFNRTRKRLEDLSKRIQQNDINLGFEFLNLPNSSISSLSDAIEVIQPLESRENLGHIIDIFHFAKGNTELNQLREIKDSLFLIQLCDVKYNPLDELNQLKESDRTFPGDGNYDLKKFLNFIINKIGYRDYFSIELLKNQCSENLYKKFFKTF